MNHVPGPTVPELKEHSPLKADNLTPLPPRESSRHLGSSARMRLSFSYINVNINVNIDVNVGQLGADEAELLLEHAHRTLDDLLGAERA